MKYFAVLLFLSLICDVYADSSINFRVTPTIFTPGITSHVTLYCSLNETTPTGTHGLVGRDVTALEHDQLSSHVTEDAGDVTTTSDVIDYVTNIVISRKSGDVLASVSDHHPPRDFLTSSDVSVTGDVTSTGVTGVRGFLQLVLKDPADQIESGVFSCEITTVTMKGHGLTLTSSAVVDNKQPTIQDLVMKLSKMEQKISAQELEILDQKQKNLEQAQKISAQEQKNQEQEQKVSAQEQKMSAQEQKMSAMEQKISSLETANSVQQQMSANLNNSLEEMTHIETGGINCGSSEFSNGGTSTRGNTVSHTFKRQYSRPPVVFLSVTRLYGAHSHDDTWYWVRVTSVSETQFYVTCWAWDASQIEYIDVSYLVIPQFE